MGSQIEQLGLFLSFYYLYQSSEAGICREEKRSGMVGGVDDDE